MKTPKPRHLIWALIALTLTALLVWGLMPSPLRVETAKVAVEPLQVTLEEEGRARVRDRFVLSAPISGYLRRVTAKVGDTVQSGQTLAQLEPLRAEALDDRRRAEAQARVEAAGAGLSAAAESVSAARTDATLAKTELERLQKLLPTQAVTEQQLAAARAASQRSEATLRSARFGEDVARHDLQAARTALRFAGDDGVSRQGVLALKSPASGALLRLLRDSEGVIMAGAPVLEVGDPAALEVVVDVLSSDAVQLQPGMAATLERWGGEPLAATVRRIEPVGFTRVSALGVDEQRVTVVLDIASPPEQWRRLGDGYRLEARFLLWQGENILQAPTAALFRQGEGWAVFTLKDGRAKMTPVTVGHRNGLQAEILTGLKAGDTVIVQPDGRISDGIRVENGQ
ncbi:MAG: HlyD family efflux transporter periplasmic adaptor subunit [Fluviicoccus sp.]|uniref:efflux RND transporter periplasmic adaptor subunit n=1 Tax=Fluviicoccus sp. TaxID=2003552 RepID=UPI0027195D85|nr:HlyD family efflux transporter periplasmic adaptor subunit [Fluviicoccus sp.]MDO8331404.1 HlyD family efflux transporter periplasmic adaptor subunit [Fluviicoccus sp.]